MKIEWTADSMFCPAIGETKTGEEYTVSDTVGKNLVTQGVAKPVKNKSKDEGGSK